MTEPSPIEPKPPAARFKILHLMVAIAIIAVLLTFQGRWIIVVAILAFPIVSMILAGWFWKRNYQTFAGLCFWGLALTVNGSYAAACRSPLGNPGIELGVLWFLILGPSLIAFGIAWGNLARRHDLEKPDETSNIRATIRFSAITLFVVMPILTAATLWPFQLKFLTLGPQLDCVADQVAAGRVVAFPVQVGQIEIFGAQFDRTTGNVLLQADRGINSPNGFVRHGPGSCYMGMLSEHRLSLGPTRRWCYHEYEN